MSANTQLVVPPPPANGHRPLPDLVPQHIEHPLQLCCDLWVRNSLIITLADKFANLLPQIETTDQLAAHLDPRCVYQTADGYLTVEFYIGDQRRIDAHVTCGFVLDPQGTILMPTVLVRLQPSSTSDDTLSFDLIDNEECYAKSHDGPVAVSLFHERHEQLCNLILALAKQRAKKYLAQQQ